MCILQGKHIFRVIILFFKKVLNEHFILLYIAIANGRDLTLQDL